MGFGVWGLGFRVWGLGFRVWGLEFGVWGLVFRVWGSRLDHTTPPRWDKVRAVGENKETVGYIR